MWVLILGRWWLDRLELTVEKLYTNSIVQSCFSMPALALEGSRSASCQITPEQQGVRSLSFHLTSFSSWPLASKELFVSGQQRAQYPPGDQDPLSHRGPILAMDPWTESSQLVVDTGSTLAWGSVGQHWSGQRRQKGEINTQTSELWPPKEAQVIWCRELWNSCSFQWDLMQDVSADKLCKKDSCSCID